MNLPAGVFFAVALFLPFAMPPYLLAFVWADLIEDNGILPAGYGIRNLLGAAFIMSLVLYPYVYMLARAVFAHRSCGLLAASRLLGCTPWQSFVRVALPAARPAIALGALLVFMETINDIAIAEDFGLATLGLQVLDLWQLRDDRSAAAAISLLLLTMAMVLAWFEAFSRRKQRQYQAGIRCYCSEARYHLRGGKLAAAIAGCSIVLALAFVIPLLVLIGKMLRSGLWQQAGLWDAALDSLWIALLAAILTFALGGMLAALRRRKVLVFGWFTKLAMASYALPGSVYALGSFLAATAVADWLMEHLGISVHWMWTSTICLLVIAISCRFAIISAGAIESGLSQVPPQLLTVVRHSGKKIWASWLQVYLPITRPALVAGLMLLVVDVLKELPLTLLLRPFGVTPLSLQIYQYAADEDLGGAAPAALVLVLLTSVALLIGYRGIAPSWYRQNTTTMPANR